MLEKIVLGCSVAAVVFYVLRSAVCHVESIVREALESAHAAERDLLTLRSAVSWAAIRNVTLEGPDDLLARYAIARRKAASGRTPTSQQPDDSAAERLVSGASEDTDAQD